MGGRGSSGNKGQRLKSELKRIENTIRENTVESVYLFNKDGNIIYSNTGRKSSCPIYYQGDMTDLLATHNHPGNAPLSYADVNLVLHNNMTGIRAVGAKGTTYSLEKTNEVTKDKQQKMNYDLKSHINKEKKLMDKRYNQIMMNTAKNGIAATEKAIESLNHDYVRITGNWLKDNASKYGYKYEERQEK